MKFSKFQKKETCSKSMMSHKDNKLLWLMHFFAMCLNNFQGKNQLFWVNLSKVVVMNIYFVFPKTKIRTVVITVYRWSEKQWITLELVLVVHVCDIIDLLQVSNFFQFRKPHILKTKQDFWMQFLGKVLEFDRSITYLFKIVAFSSPLRTRPL